MSNPPKRHPIAAPDMTGAPLYADQAQAGPDIDPIDRLRICTPDYWEKLIAAWAEGQIGEYKDAHRLGGSGDMGYDIVAERHDGAWDCFQAKHYDKHLTPANACTEIGKVIYHCYANGLTLPAKYIFVAPQDCSADLTNLMQNAKRMKVTVIDNWDTRCRKKITAKQDIPLEGELLQYLNQFNFSTFSSLSPLKLIRHFRENTSYYHVFFGGQLKPRPPASKPPPVATTTEALYIGKLLDAYVDSGSVSAPVDILALPKSMLAHYTSARQAFYSAESLRIYARECAHGQFEDLRDQFYHGILSDLQQQFPHGYARLLHVASQAKLIKTELAIETRVRIPDRIGMCHHLANDPDLDVTWVPHAD